MVESGVLSLPLPATGLLPLPYSEAHQPVSQQQVSSEGQVGNSREKQAGRVPPTSELTAAWAASHSAGKWISVARGRGPCRAGHIRQLQLLLNQGHRGHQPGEHQPCTGHTALGAGPWKPQKPASQPAEHACVHSVPRSFNQQPLGARCVPAPEVGQGCCPQGACTPVGKTNRGLRNKASVRPSGTGETSHRPELRIHGPRGLHRLKSTKHRGVCASWGTPHCLRASPPPAGLPAGDH